MSAREARAWAVRSATHALEAGAERVSLIPLRSGNGALDALGAEGELESVRLEDLEQTLTEALEVALRLGRGIVEADLWDARNLAECVSCADSRLGRLAEMNASGVVSARSFCAVCGG